MLAALLVLFATQRPGPGLDPDAMAYTGAARSLVRHGTLRVPTGDWSSADSTSALSFWPPGYPAAIAIPVAAGASSIQGGRFVNVVAAAVTAATLFFTVAAAAGDVAGGVAVLALLSTPAVLDVHLSVLSEPLFIAFLALAVALMAYARDRLWLLGGVAAAAVMVRYAGAAVPAAAVTWMLLDSRFAPGRRLRRAVAVAVLPAAAMGGWFLRTALAPDRHGTPHVTLYGHWGGTLRQGGETLSQWLAPLVPTGAQPWVAGALAVVLTLLLLATARDTAPSRFRREPAARSATVLSAAALLALWYVVVIGASRLLVGGTIPFDGRILAPLIILLETMIVVAVAHWWRAYHRPLQVAIAVAVLAWIAASAATSAGDVTAAVTDGSDFAATAWHDSPTLAWVRAHGAGHALYSNWPPAVYFHAHRIARELPDSDEVRHDLADFAETLRRSNGVVVGFDEPCPDVVPPDSLARLLSLRPLARLADGTVWGL